MRRLPLNKSLNNLPYRNIGTILARYCNPLQIVSIKSLMAPVRSGSHQGNDSERMFTVRVTIYEV
jgi:hypothetical protein